MKKKPSKAIVHALRSLLKERNIEFSFGKTCGKFSFGLYCQKGIIKKMDYRAEITAEAIFLTADFPLGVDPLIPSRLLAMCEFVTRANNILMNGAIDFDLQLGTISFKLYADCADAVPSRESIGRYICTLGSIQQMFSSGIVDTILGVDAKTAFERCVKENRLEACTLKGKILSGEEESASGDAAQEENNDAKSFEYCECDWPETLFQPE